MWNFVDILLAFQRTRYTKCEVIMLHPSIALGLDRLSFVQCLEITAPTMRTFFKFLKIFHLTLLTSLDNYQTWLLLSSMSLLSCCATLVIAPSVFFLQWTNSWFKNAARKISRRETRIYKKKAKNVEENSVKFWLGINGNWMEPGGWGKVVAAVNDVDFGTPIVIFLIIFIIMAIISIIDRFCNSTRYMFWHYFVRKNNSSHYRSLIAFGSRKVICLVCLKDCPSRVCPHSRNHCSRLYQYHQRENPGMLLIGGACFPWKLKRF